jgi:hypothetical protein
LAVTEMQPTPPWALKPSAVASSPESWTKSLPQVMRCSETRSILPVASLTPTMFLMRLGERPHRFRRHVDHRAAGNVVDDDRQRDGFGDRLVMRDQALLGRLVVIGRDDEQRIRADGFSACWASSIASTVLLEPAPAMTGTRLGGDFDAEFDHPLVLVMGERRRFSRGADRHEAGGCPPKSAIRHARRRLASSTAAIAREGRDECGNGSLIHAMNSSGAEIHASAAF